MQRNERIRRLMRLVPWPTLLLAVACGGDKGPTGPGGGDMEQVTYDLVSLGRVGLPTDAQLEGCTVTRFYSGGLQVTDDGSWQIRLQVHDQDGDWGYEDDGEVEEDGGAFWFVSTISRALATQRSRSLSSDAPAGAATPPGPIPSHRSSSHCRNRTPSRRRPHRRRTPAVFRAATCWSGSTNRSRASW